MPEKDANEGPAIGDIVLYNPADSRGWVEATITRVRDADPDGEATVNLTYPHHRTDVEALATAERVRHGVGAYMYCTVDERPREPSAPTPASSVTPIGEAAEPGAVVLVDATENIAGLEQALRVALGLAPDADPELVKARLEVARGKSDAISKILGTNDPDDGDDDEHELLCVIEGCEKSEAGNGYKTLGSLRRHAAEKHDGATVLVGDAGAITYGEKVDGTAGATVTHVSGGSSGGSAVNVSGGAHNRPTGVPTSANPETSHSSGSGGGQPPAAKQ